MEGGKNNITNTTLTNTNYSHTNYLERDKLNDSTGSEFLEQEEKSIFEKINEKPNFIKSLTHSAYMLGNKKLNKLKENSVVVKDKSLDITRNGICELNFL